MEFDKNISIIMPTFNRGFCIERSIKSVINQVGLSGKIELIIVDDNSTDNTRLIIERIKEELLTHDTSFDLIYKKLDSNVGGGQARNVGLELANYDIVSFIDSDVEWYPTKLAEQMDKLKGAPRYTVVYSGYRKQISFSQMEWIECLSKLNDKNVSCDILYGNFVDTPGILTYKSNLDHINGFDNSLPRFQDWDLVIRLSQFCEFILCAKVLYDSYTMPNSITANDRARIYAYVIIFNKIKNRLSVKGKFIFFLRFLNGFMIDSEFKLDDINQPKVIKYAYLLSKLMPKKFFFMVRGRLLNND